MRRHSHRFTFVTLAATALALVAWMSVASATVLYTDTFNYVDGNLVGKGAAPAWYAHSGGGSAPIQVAYARAVVGQASGSREDITKQFTPAQSTTAKTYASFLLNVPSGATWTGDDYFAHFKPYPTAADTFNYKGRVYVGAFAGGDYTVGVSVTSSGTSPVVKWGSALTYGVTYRIVVSYDATAGSSELWVDPVDESSTKIVSGPFPTAAGSGIGAYCLRQGSGNTSTQYFDNLVIGTTFADVVAPVVPASGNWGLALMALLLAGVGTAFVLRRRQATA